MPKQRSAGQCGIAAQPRGANIRIGSILLKKSEGVFCAQFPVEPSLADAAMIQGAY
jgi:hypothetical protein